MTASVPAVTTHTAFTSWELWALRAVLATAFLGLAYAAYLILEVRRADTGTEKMRQIARAIRDGANAYLHQQFRAILGLIGLVAVALLFSAAVPAIGWGRAGAFVMGALFSATVGYVGMNMAVQGNVRVAAAARTSFGKSLQIAYRTGTITGMLTDSLGLLGGTLIFMAYGEQAYEVLLGFGFGGTLLALFMRVGGGIYTKSADVGADLVGKLEKSLPEDDPRNAATIADNVGDNVGDCAGMAADIFESYEVTMVSAMILGWACMGHKGVVFPLLVRAVGLVASIIGTYAVRTSDQVRNAMKAINVGFVLSAVASILGFTTIGWWYLRTGAALPAWASWGVPGLDMRPVWATFVGIVLAVGLNRLTEYFTQPGKRPVDFIVKTTPTGHATTIINGLAVGMESTVWAALVIAGAIGASVLIYQGMSPTYIAYGVAMCGIGMLTLTGNNISMDVFGPVADNANGIGEMARLEPAARRTLADLDAVGNTTKAITKGIAIGSAVIAAVSLFNAYLTDIGHLLGKGYEDIAGLLSVADPMVFIGLLIGGAVPFLFSSLMIRAVGRGAAQIVHEVRAQFQDPQIVSGQKDPDYARVVGICTRTAQHELLGPGLLAIITPILVGIFLHKAALGGFLAGLILTGQLMAVFMANAGGAWDNAKKAIEDGLFGGKGSEAHKAAITGDTVGDPLKDTAGPALNPLIKVINMVALLIVPFVVRAETSTGLWKPILLIAGLGLLAFTLRRSWREEEIEAPTPPAARARPAEPLPVR